MKSIHLLFRSEISSPPTPMQTMNLVPEEEEKQREHIAAPILHRDTDRKLSKELMSLFNRKAMYVINEDLSVTFWPTPDCKMASKPLQAAKMSMQKIVQFAGCAKLEASSKSELVVIETYHPICSFIEASLEAWALHYPIRFKPEHIWLLILQAVAVHVNQNAEKLRTKFVNHERKIALEVQRDEFVLGSDTNDWKDVIQEFMEQIDANTVQDTVQLVDCDFSGSTIMDKLCAKVTIIGPCKSYSECGMNTICGFPQIKLDGTKGDWLKLKEKTIVLLRDKVNDEFGSEWGKALLPVLDRFIGAFEGDIDCLFWNSMIKRGAQGGSGGSSFYSGWINVFFPFTTGDMKNQSCVPYSMDSAYVLQGFQKKMCTVSTGSMSLWGDEAAGGEVAEFPTGLGEAPVNWKCDGRNLRLKLITGFIGFQQDPTTLEICANLGWCIAHEKILVRRKRKPCTAVHRERLDQV